MDTAPEIITVEPCPAIAIRTELPISELPQFFGDAFHELAERAGDLAAGPPFARYHRFGPDGVEVEAVMPLSSDIPGGGRVAAIHLDGGPAVQVRHLGPYDELPATYASIEHWLEEHHRDRADAVREIYLTSPGEVPDPMQWVTVVVQPIREPVTPP